MEKAAVSQITVQYVGVARRGLPAANRFRQWARSALPDIALGLGIRLVSTTEIMQLNQSYRGKPGSTNVLSFPVDADVVEHSKWLGDIVICPDVAIVQASEQAKPFSHHLAHLTIHGVLHLRGYDHINREDAQVMETLETALLTSQGIADPYADIIISSQT